MKRVFLVGLALLAMGCGDDEPYGSPSGSAGSAGAGGVGGGSGGGTSTASFKVQPSVEQLFITHAAPAADFAVHDSADAVVAEGTSDDLGSLIFRELTPGDGYTVKEKGGKQEQVGPLTVMSVSGSTPSQDFYSGQKLVAGSNYITVRDGTKLAVYITLPGPIEDGPFPTVVNYSGYSPAQPGEPLGNFGSLCGQFPVLCDAPTDASALISGLNSYATVGVNMRGTGCSGGAYDFFEMLQLLDGYDVIETVAAQDWVLHNKVGMTGLSYPGISQMFVAKTHPPSLAAITPLSVIGSTHTTLVPGGILNDGFALSWATSVLNKADPYAQGWEQAQVDAGDTTCEENQLLHGQKVDILKKAAENQFYTAEIVDPLNPSLFVDQIDVPVFLASSFQDEQTGPYFFELLDRFDNAKPIRITAYNGVHVDGFAPQVLVEWKTFLDFYVAKRIPKIDDAVRTVAPLLFQQVFGVSVPMPPDRFATYTDYNKALADYESEPPVRVIFENGGATPVGAPIGTFDETFSAWPPPTQPKRYYFQADGSLTETAPTASDSASQFELDPAAGQRGILGPKGGIWDPLPDYAWAQPAPGKAVVFETAPLTADMVLLGSASVDLWLRSNVDDADLEVNLTEVRPDGKEMYVQSGWLRASHRKVAAGSTELWPVHSFTQADNAPLKAGEWVEVRVGVPAFSHVFRSGSRIRVVVDTPGDSRAEWRFDLKSFASTAVHQIGHDATRSSSVVLPVVNVTATSPLPACPSLRGQQCRDHTAFINTAATP